MNYEIIYSGIAGAVLALFGKYLIDEYKEKKYYDNLIILNIAEGHNNFVNAVNVYESNLNYEFPKYTFEYSTWEKSKMELAKRIPIDCISELEMDINLLITYNNKSLAEISSNIDPYEDVVELIKNDIKLLLNENRESYKIHKKIKRFIKKYRKDKELTPLIEYIENTVEYYDRQHEGRLTYKQLKLPGSYARNPI